VAAEPNKKTPGGPDAERAKMMRVLIPAGAIALVVILVAVIASVSGGGRKMSDGSDGSAEDPGLKEISPGVKIRDLKEGQGKECPPGATVKINYTGWLTDGSVFDSNKDRGPTELALGGLIPGWQKGIPGMKPGGVRKLVISADMGYGNQNRPKIPPGSTLIFEVELLDLKEPPAPLTGPGKPMTDGSNGGTEDDGLKDIGSGLKIRDLKEGSGEPVKPGATVTVHYTGWTVDGNVFDSSKTRAPFEANLDPNAAHRVIPGWQKGIPGMKPGGVRKLVVPPGLGYGEAGFPPKIPGNATLIFEVELIK
jgi:peptidylprolyl isomerase